MTEHDHIRTAAAMLDDPVISRDKYPEWVCSSCGSAYGRKQAGICTIHYGTCGVCGRDEMVTEPRDWGHLRDGWQEGV